MCKDVALGYNLAPLNLRMFVSEAGGYISGGFTNNLNVAFDSATQKTVGVVLSKGLADKKLPDSL
jgi:hypothetical protein